MNLAVFLVFAIFCHSSIASAKRKVAFECTERQETEDLAAIEAKEHRYHQSMVRLGLCALQLAEDDTSPEGRLQSGVALRKKKLLEGVAWLEKAASLDDPEAKNNLAILYSKGHGVGKQDHTKAHAYFLEAAGDGCADAQFNLGALYDTGRDGVVTADAAAAAHWFSQAADRNHYEATHALALMEVAGRGVEVDMERAAKRFRKLAAPEVQPPYPNAQYMLALLALKGACPAELLSGLLPGDDDDDDDDGAGGKGHGGNNGNPQATASSSSSSSFAGVTVAGVAQPAMARAVRLLRLAADAGHPQAKAQVAALFRGAPEDEQQRVVFEEKP